MHWYLTDYVASTKGVAHLLPRNLEGSATSFGVMTLTRNTQLGDPCLLATADRLPTETGSRYLGDDAAKAMISRDKSALETTLQVPSFSGATIREILPEIYLTSGKTWFNLRRGRNHRLLLHAWPEGKIYDQATIRGGAHPWDEVQTSLRQWIANGGNLGVFQRKYRLTDDDMIAASYGLVGGGAGPLTESFPTDQADLATNQDLTWTEVFNNIDVVSGRASNRNTNVWHRARAEHDLDGDDHYCECVINYNVISSGNVAAGPMIRYAAGADTGYLYTYWPSAGEEAKLWKVTAGTTAAIAGAVADIAAPEATTDYTVRGSVSADDLHDFLLGGASQFTHTNGDITGNTRFGIGMFSNVDSRTRCDNVEAADNDGGGGATEVPLSGSQPAATGALSLDAEIAIAGAQPAPSGSLTSKRSASLAGAQPAATGGLTIQSVAQVAGEQPAASGALSISASIALAGSQPAPAGDLVVSQDVALAGAQPASTGALSSAASIALAGAQPAATGAIAAEEGVFVDIAGSQPAPSGALSISASIALVGNQPAPSGDLATDASIALSGVQPAPSGALLVFLTAVLAGAQPAASGVLVAAAVGPPPFSLGVTLRRGPEGVTLKRYPGDVTLNR
jgi:hypothetical protein